MSIRAMYASVQRAVSASCTRGDKLVISQDSSSNIRCVWKSRSLAERIANWFGSFKPEDQATIDHLRLFLGERRFSRVCRQLRLSNAFRINQNILHYLLVGSCDIREAELEERSKSLSGRALMYTGPQERLDLYQSMIRECEGTWRRTTSEYDLMHHSGKGLAGLEERTKVQVDACRYHEEQRSDQDKIVHDIEMLTSRWIDREPVEGTLIRLKDGLYVCDRIFNKKGAYIVALRPLNRLNSHILVCRGTSFRVKATGGIRSGFNNIALYPGWPAAEANWKAIREYLREKNVRAVDLYGKSQGGAHAQLLAPLIKQTTTTQVRSLNTYGSIGVPDAVNKIFSKAFRCSPLQQRLVNNLDDCVRFVGGRHAARMHAEVYFLAPTEVEATDSRTLQGKVLKSFLKSFVRAHSRQTTLRSYSIIQGDLSDLRTVKFLEKIRKVMARIFHYLTLGLFNPISYEIFYQKELERFQQETSCLQNSE